jgi:phosphohistidine phosphatase
MDLILWRHADAVEGAPDLARELSPKGREQAARVAAWMHRHLPAGFEVVASPALRAQQTAEALQRPLKTEKRLAPGAGVQAILKAAHWPDHAGAVVVVGHQPDLGHAIAFLVCGEERDWRLKKGGLCWIAENGSIKALLSPDLLQD